MIHLAKETENAGCFKFLWGTRTQQPLPRD